MSKLERRALRLIADGCYFVGIRLYDFGRRLDRFSFGVPWKDAK